ncbi:hypothetical protein [Nesterenkonia suensis]
MTTAEGPGRPHQDDAHQDDAHQDDAHQDDDATATPCRGERPQAPPSGAVTQRSEQSPGEARAYWTLRRRREAKPPELVREAEVPEDPSEQG